MNRGVYPVRLLVTGRFEGNSVSRKLAVKLHPRQLLIRFSRTRLIFLWDSWLTLTIKQEVSSWSDVTPDSSQPFSLYGVVFHSCLPWHPLFHYFGKEIEKEKCNLCHKTSSGGVFSKKHCHRIRFAWSCNASSYVLLSPASVSRSVSLLLGVADMLRMALLTKEGWSLALTFLRPDILLYTLFTLARIFFMNFFFKKGMVSFYYPSIPLYL